MKILPSCADHDQCYGEKEVGKVGREFWPGSGKFKQDSQGKDCQGGDIWVDWKEVRDEAL